MRTLDDFHRAVQSTLATKRLGTPVFVRYLLQGPIAVRAVPSFLAQIVHTVSTWLDQDLHRIYALGAVKSRHVTLTLEYDRGASSQLTWAGAPQNPGLDLILVGNRGALYHDTGLANPWQRFPALPSEAAPKELNAWIDRALKSNQPEPAPR